MEPAQRDKIYNIAKNFNIELESAERSRDTATSEVYTINNSYILRGQKRFEGDILKCKKEISIIERIRHFLDLKLPKLKEDQYGKLYIETPDFLWSLYPKIQGEIICTWFNMEKCHDGCLVSIMKLLKKIHLDTAGKFDKSEQNLFIDDKLPEIFKRFKSSFSEKVFKRIDKSFEEVSKRRKKLTAESLVFTHNDFHPGNIVFDHSRPVGLIDFSFAGIGDPLEDLAYSVMMLMRIYCKGEFIFDRKRYDLLISSYGLKQEEKEIFYEYLILFALFDIHYFKNLCLLPNKDFYFSYQLSMIECLINAESVWQPETPLPKAHPLHL